VAPEPPTHDLLAALRSADMYVYMGHGSGDQYWQQQQPAATGAPHPGRCKCSSVVGRRAVAGSNASGAPTMDSGRSRHSCCAAQGRAVMAAALLMGCSSGRLRHLAALPLVDRFRGGAGTPGDSAVGGCAGMVAFAASGHQQPRGAPLTHLAAGG
jgi:hypothetical protein